MSSDWYESKFERLTFMNRQACMDYIDSHHDLFTHVSYSYAPQSDGTWLLVF